jgi:hypothetical protein
MITEELIIAGICGIAGALAKDIFVDNAISLPKKDGEKLILGSLGGLIIGAFVGIALDGSPVNAFAAGFAGIAILQSMIDGKDLNKTIIKRITEENTEENKEKETIKEKEIIKEEKKTEEAKTENEIIDLIKKTAKKYNIDEELAVRVAKCESGLNPKAININAPDSIDRGLYQINSKWHPEVTEEQAFNIQFSINFFCEAVKNGYIRWWKASQKCWETKKT